MSNPQLMKFLNFNEADLQTNRNGQISEKQKARLQEIEAEAKRRTLLGVAGNFVVALIGLGGVLYAMTIDDLSFSFKITMGLVFGILWPLWWGAAGISGLRRMSAKIETTLKKAQGRINIVKAVRSSYDSDSRMTTQQNIYQLRVGGYTFMVSPVLSNYMNEGDVYAIYFADFNLAEKSKEILSVELLNGTSAPNTSSTDDVEIVEHIKRGDMMGAIKVYRSIHNSSFEEAKAVVEDIKARLGD